MATMTLAPSAGYEIHRLGLFLEASRLEFQADFVGDTGYFDGAEDHPLAAGEAFRITANDGREALVIGGGEKYRNVVLFERYVKGSRIVMLANSSRNKPRTQVTLRDLVGAESSITCIDLEDECDAQNVAFAQRLKAAAAALKAANA